MSNKSDRDRLREAFAELRKRGWYARMNYWCCQSCGWADASEKLKAKGKDPDTTNVIFWHNQDDTAFCYSQLRGGEGEKGHNLHGKLYLAHQGNAYEAVGVLVAHGLLAYWDGDEGSRILVRPRPQETAWQRSERRKRERAAA